MSEFLFFFSALKPRLYWDETALQLSENKALLAICQILTCVVSIELRVAVASAP
jgi:hypothetical protein